MTNTTSFTATQINNAAAQDADRFGDSNVYICNVYKILNPSISLEQFKAELVEMNRKGDIELTRADLVQVMNRDIVKASEVNYLNATFNFVKLPKHLRSYL